MCQKRGRQAGSCVTPWAGPGSPHACCSLLNYCRLCRLDAQVAGWGRPPPSSLTFSGGWLLEELRLTVTVPWLGSRPGWRLHSYSVFIYLLSLGWSQGGPNPTSLPWAPSALESPALPKLLWFPPAETSILRQGAGPKTVMEVLVLAPHLGMCPPSSAPALFWESGRMDKKMEPKLQHPAEPDAHPRQGRAPSAQSWSCCCHSALLALFPAQEGACLSPATGKDTYLIRLYKIIIITKNNNTVW